MDIKVCDICKNNPANIHLTQIVQDEVTVQHLCEECAKEKGISIVIEDKQDPFPSVISNETIESVPEIKQEEKVSCPQCSITFEEFKEKGRLGCASCYTAFKKEINSLLIQVHGDTEHRGKKYGVFQEPFQKDDDVSFLRQELENAIQNEKFELAAVIRDKINSVTFNKSTEREQD